MRKSSAEKKAYHTCYTYWVINIYLLYEANTQELTYAKPIKIENIFKNRPYNPDRNYSTELNLVASMAILYELLKS